MDWQARREALLAEATKGRKGPTRRMVTPNLDARQAQASGVTSLPAIVEREREAGSPSTATGGKERMA